MGVKKSTVCTRARLSVSLYTPASSLVSNPTSTFSFGTRGKLASTWSKTFGLSLDAQPAAFTCAVNFALNFSPYKPYNSDKDLFHANFCRIDACLTVWLRGGAGVARAASGSSHEERASPPRPERLDVRAPGRHARR